MKKILLSFIITLSAVLVLGSCGNKNTEAEERIYAELESFIIAQAKHIEEYNGVLQKGCEYVNAPSFDTQFAFKEAARNYDVYITEAAKKKSELSDEDLVVMEDMGLNSDNYISAFGENYGHTLISTLEPWEIFYDRNSSAHLENVSLLSQMLEIRECSLELYLAEPYGWMDFAASAKPGVNEKIKGFVEEHLAKYIDNFQWTTNKDEAERFINEALTSVSDRLNEIARSSNAESDEIRDFTSKTNANAKLNVILADFEDILYRLDNLYALHREALLAGIELYKNVDAEHHAAFISAVIAVGEGAEEAKNFTSALTEESYAFMEEQRMRVESYKDLTEDYNGFIDEVLSYWSSLSDEPLEKFFGDGKTNLEKALNSILTYGEFYRTKFVCSDIMPWVCLTNTETNALVYNTLTSYPNLFTNDIQWYTDTDELFDAARERLKKSYTIHDELPYGISREKVQSASMDNIILDLDELCYRLDGVLFECTNVVELGLAYYDDQSEEMYKKFQKAIALADTLIKQEKEWKSILTEADIAVMEDNDFISECYTEDTYRYYYENLEFIEKCLGAAKDIEYGVMTKADVNKFVSLIYDGIKMTRKSTLYLGIMPWASTTAPTVNRRIFDTAVQYRNLFGSEILWATSIKDITALYKGEPVNE